MESKPIYLELFGKQVLENGKPIIINTRFTHCAADLGLFGDEYPKFIYRYDKARQCDLCSVVGFFFTEHIESGIEYCLTCSKNVGYDK